MSQSKKLSVCPRPNSKAEILLLGAGGVLSSAQKAGSFTSSMGALTKFVDYIVANKTRCQP